MKIGLDLRLTSEDNLFSDFLIELTNEIVKKDKKNNFIIYNNSSKFKNLEKNKNIFIKNVNIKNGSLKEQTTFYKILKKDKNDLVVFFDHNKPLLYKKYFFLFIYSLENIYYQNFDNLFTKYKYQFLLKAALKKADKIICFESNTVDEISERFNLKSNKTVIIKGFFPGTYNIKYDEFLKLDTKSKYNIKKDFFIYSSGSGIHKNIERLINLIKRLKDLGKITDLVFLGNDISKDIYLREIIIKFKLQDQIHFLGEIKGDEEKNLFSECNGVILPSFYEPFPFSLKNAVLSNTPIMASNIDSIKNIFNNKINYFSPISTSDLEKKILLFLINIKKNNYQSILEIYNRENTAKEFLKIISL